MFNKQLNSFLPKIYDNITEIDALMQSEQNIIDEFNTTMSTLFANTFVFTADENGVIMFEKILGIISNPSTESLEFRRMRIINRFSMSPPFTLRFLHSKLDEIIGKNKWSTFMDYENYTLYVESSMSDINLSIEAAYTINSIKPANIVYINMPKIFESVQVTEQQSRLKRIYNYALKSWKLGQKPFASDECFRTYYNKIGTFRLGQLPFAYSPVRQYNYMLGAWKLGDKRFTKFIPEEVFKLPTNESISGEFLQHIAEFSLTDVSKARINGSIIIDKLEKQLSGTTGIIKYLIPDGTEVNKIELLDMNNTILTSAIVYVPAGINTVIKHDILIKEGES